MEHHEPPSEIIPHKRKRNPWVLVGERSAPLPCCGGLLASWSRKMCMRGGPASCTQQPRLLRRSAWRFHKPAAPQSPCDCRLVLTGSAATAGVLLGGLVAFKNGNSALAQHFMRARVVTQGITVGGRVVAQPLHGGWLAAVLAAAKLLLCVHARLEGRVSAAMACLRAASLLLVGAGLAQLRMVRYLRAPVCTEPARCAGTTPSTRSRAGPGRDPCS